MWCARNQAAHAHCASPASRAGYPGHPDVGGVAGHGHAGTPFVSSGRTAQRGAILPQRTPVQRRLPVAQAAGGVLWCACTSLVNLRAFDGPPCPCWSMTSPACRAGLAHFRAADYFAAHDAWEEVLQGPARPPASVLAGHDPAGRPAPTTTPTATGAGCRGQWSKALDKCRRLGADDGGAHQAAASLAAILQEALQAVAAGEDPLPAIADFAAGTVGEDWFEFS